MVNSREKYKLPMLHGRSKFLDDRRAKKGSAAASSESKNRSYVTQDAHTSQKKTECLYMTQWEQTFKENGKEKNVTYRVYFVPDL
jgi:hypothetical protein